MGYEIIYDKQFIKADKFFVPMILAGSNNCYQFDRSNRGRRSRDWGAVSYICDGQQLATAETILANIEKEREAVLARERDADDPDPLKSYGYYSSLAIGGSTRRTTFAAYKGLFVTGMKKALTVEQLKEEGVGVNVHMYDYNGEHEKKALAQRIPWLGNVTVTSTLHLLETIKLFTETYTGTEFSWYVGFDEWNLEDKMKRIRRKYFPVSKANVEYESVRVDQYFTVKTPNGYFFYKRIKYGYKFSPYPQHKFLTKKEAQRFADRMKGKIALTVEEINQPTVLNVPKKS